MVSTKSRTRVRTSSKNSSIIRTITDSKPEQVIGIKTSRVFSQIARMGRNPKKRKERALLISSLENASVTVHENGQIIKKYPLYVPMKAYDVMLCFGKQLERMPEASLVQIVK